MKREYIEEQHEDDEIELMDLVFVLVSKWKLIAGSVLIGLIIGIVGAVLKTDVYTASTKLMVANSVYSGRNIDRNELSLNQQLTSTYTEIAKDREIAYNIIKKFGLSGTPESLGSRISVRPVGDTEFISISYTDKEPKMAALISNEVSKEFILRVRRVMGIENLKVVEEATRPMSPSGTSKKLLVIIGLILGGMVGVGLTFLLEFFHNTIRKPEDIEKIMGVQVIGSIPDFEDLEEREARGAKK